MSAATPIDSSAFDRVVDALERAGMKRQGPKWTCPAHDDRTPSLSVTAAAGKCMVHCFAGCEASAIVDAIGLSIRDLFDEPRSGSRPDFMERATKPRTKPPKTPKPHRVYRDFDELKAAVERSTEGKVVARYDYLDEQRNVVLCVFRTDGKRFMQASPDGTGWKLSAAGARLVPFHLPELISAVAAGDTIHIVEGEKDVLAIEAAGGFATCNPMGAGKPVEQYAEHFRDAERVCIVADRDEPGRKHAQAWAAALHPIVKSVEIVEAVEGKDAADAIASGHSLEAAFAPPRPAIDTKRFVFVGRDAFDYLRAAPEPAWLVPSFLRVGKTTVMGGSTMTGKTWLALQTLSSIAAGVPVWPGTDADVSEGVVVYIGYDPHMTVEDVVRRLDVLDKGRHRAAQSMKPGAWSERFVTIGSSEQRGGFPIDRYRLDAEGCERIASEILRPIERERGPIRAIAVDTLSTALPLGVDENDNPAMTAVISRLSGLALDFKAAALTLHHPTKANSSAGAKFQSWDPLAYFRGAGAIPSAAGVLAGMWAPIEHPTHRVLTCWSNSGRRKRWWFEVASPERSAESWIDYWWPGEAPESAAGEDEGEALESLAKAFAADRSERLSFHAFVERTKGGYSGAARKGGNKLIEWATKRGYLSREFEGAKRLFLTPDGVLELAPFWGEANVGDFRTV